MSTLQTSGCSGTLRRRWSAPQQMTATGRPMRSLLQVYLPIGWSTYFFSAARVTFNSSEVARAKVQVRLPRTCPCTPAV